MGDAGYRGISAEQDGRFRNKEHALLKKLAASGQFPAHFDQRVNMKDVNVSVMRPWIAERIEELLGFEDDVVVEYVNGMLEDPENRQPDPRKMQLSLTGFLEGSTAKFMSELWTLLLSAQTSIGGIPQQFVDKKKEEMRLARERDAAAIALSGAARGSAYASGRGEHDDRRRTYSGRPAGHWQNDERPHNPRWQERRSNARDQSNQRGILNKSGVRTERVQDSGWGTRGPRRPRSRDDDDGVRRGDYDEERSRMDYVLSSHRHSNRSRDREASPVHPSQRSRDTRHSRSVSPPPRQRRRQDGASLTPEWKGDHRRGGRGRSPSITPPRRSGRARSPSITPPRRAASRSPTYSPPQPSQRYPARGSPSRTRPTHQQEVEKGKSKVKRSRWDRED